MKERATCKKCKLPNMSFAKYQEGVKRTEAILPHDMGFDFPLLYVLLRQSVLISELLDQYKKCLFYGRAMDQEKIAKWREEMQVLNAGNSPIEYVPGDTTGMDFRLIHSVLGAITETGEITHTLIKGLSQGHFKPEDLVNLGEELGDCEWYRAIMYDVLGMDELKVREVNLAKLKARYGDKFTSEKAINRDLDAELKLLKENL
jgi:NTP pyrophosphatase (non-canonical NTP hydrolase)